MYGNTLILIVLDGPNKDQPNFYSSVRDTLIEKDNDPNIICGDWNMVFDFSIDTHNYLCENNINSRKKGQRINVCFRFSRYLAVLKPQD